MSNYLNKYYTEYCNEDNRLKSRKGKIEFITTMKYIHDYVPSGKILEVGAGTGRYSIALAREGYDVSAVELIEHNIEIFKSNLSIDDKIDIYQGNAKDLSMFKDKEFDAVLLLGPMYHLYNIDDKLKALEEAKRVVKDDGYIYVAYCMNEATIMQYAFKDNGQNMIDLLDKKMLTKDYHCISKEIDIFEMVRIEDINKYNEMANLKRVKIIGTDMFSYYIKDHINSFTTDAYKEYVKYHLSICEREDLIGIGNHTLDILRK